MKTRSYNTSRAQELSMSESWVDRYRPESYDEVGGNNKAVDKIAKWAENYSKGDKPWLLWGEQGTGKTSTAEVVAKENGWPFEEINASSARKKEDVAKFASQIRNKPIDADRKLVLIDEADGFGKGSSLRPLAKVLEDSPNPVIVTCNEKWKVPNSIANKCRNQKFKLGKRTKKSVIKKIVEEEDLDISKREIGILATRDDLRSIINDLQRFSEGQEEVSWDDRDTDIGPYEAVDNILQEKKYTGELSPPDLVGWLDENLAGRFEGVEGMRAYQALAHADLWLEEAQRTQNYSWWKYAGEIAEQTANVRLSEPYDGWINKDFPKAWRNSTPNPNGDSEEARLYQELKKPNVPGYSFSSNFIEFKNDALPLLKKRDKEEKMQIALQHGLSNKAMKALGISKSEYEDWMETDFDGDHPEQVDLSDWSDEEQEEDEEESEDEGGEAANSLLEL